VALHTAYVKELDLLPYLALTTTTGAVQLWQGDIVQWTREEGLSRLQVAEMAELPERKTIATHITGQDETFVGRARRQLADAKVRFENSAVGSIGQLMCRRRGCPNMSSTLPRGL
jgi:hypothetical protein